jgi:hypothetical protein
MWRGEPQSRRRCGGGGRGPCTDVAGASSSPSADVAGASPSPGADVGGLGPVTAQIWEACATEAVKGAARAEREEEQRDQHFRAALVPRDLCDAPGCGPARRGVATPPGAATRSPRGRDAAPRRLAATAVPHAFGALRVSRASAYSGVQALAAGVSAPASTARHRADGRDGRVPRGGVVVDVRRQDLRARRRSAGAQTCRAQR